MPLCTTNLRVESLRAILSPAELLSHLPADEHALRTCDIARQQIQSILCGKDPRLLVVVGPCSIHDPEAAIEYAKRLVTLRDKVKETMILVMRVYFEKPRTTLGWKGLINDPHLNGTFDMEAGLATARRILLEINAMGLPAATEFLDPIIPQYIADLIAWAAIGARTTESQTHRQMASGLSMPVGFKNGTDGSLQVAIDATTAARSSHHFLGVDDQGRTCVVVTKGNCDGHLILRGGHDGPNYDTESINSAAEQLIKADLPASIMVDCSHANSNKQYELQKEVFANLISQRVNGQTAITGAMLESNLGNSTQKIPATLSEDAYILDHLKPGVSITDACIGWDETEQLLLDAHKRLLD